MVRGFRKYEVRLKRLKLVLLEHSASDFRTNQKLMCDFLLVINTNLPHILHRFQIMADYWSNFC